MIGKTLAHYRILSKLGEGGMGEVYRAEDTRLGREVAIKVLPEALANDPERLARLEREARILAAVEHPNLAAVYGLERVDGRRLLVMQLAAGETLEARIARGALPAEEAMEIALRVARALEVAHEKGIVHRDLKPGNVMVADRSQVTVLDFGLAKALDASPEEGAEAGEAATLLAQGTQPGMIMGTTAYMSPEQARGRPVDKRTDIWSFGCLLFEMLAGGSPFEGESPSDVLAAILQREPDWGRLPSDLAPGLLHLLQRCLRKEPMDRLRDIGDARIELTESLAGGRPPGPPVGGATASELSDHREAEAAVAGGESGRRQGWRRWLLAAMVAVVALGAVTIVARRLLPDDIVVYLIDTTAPLGVYDEATRRAGGTNADDLTDALGDLPLTLIKENSSPWWRREHQVLMTRPDLVVIHHSAFAHQPRLESFEAVGEARARAEELGLEDPLELGRSKLLAFLGYLALGSSETKFLVYSRAAFADESDAARWIAEAETRFPELAGRLFVFDVPGEVGAASFRDPVTAEQIERRVVSLLGID